MSRKIPQLGAGALKATFVVIPPTARSTVKADNTESADGNPTDAPVRVTFTVENIDVTEGQALWSSSSTSSTLRDGYKDFNSGQDASTGGAGVGMVAGIVAGVVIMLSIVVGILYLHIKKQPTMGQLTGHYVSNPAYKRPEDPLANPVYVRSDEVDLAPMQLGTRAGSVMRATSLSAPLSSATQESGQGESLYESLRDAVQQSAPVMVRKPSIRLEGWRDNYVHDDHVDVSADNEKDFV